MAASSAAHRLSTCNPQNTLRPSKTQLSGEILESDWRLWVWPGRQQESSACTGFGEKGAWKETCRPTGSHFTCSTAWTAIPLAVRTKKCKIILELDLYPSPYWQGPGGIKVQIYGSVISWWRKIFTVVCTMPMLKNAFWKGHTLSGR